MQTLKIDRSFVAPRGADTDAAVLAGAVLALAGKLGLRVVAEGVETVGQAEVLRGLGCRHVQGFLFGRPVPVDDLAPTGTPGRQPDSTSPPGAASL